MLRFKFYPLLQNVLRHTSKGKQPYGNLMLCWFLYVQRKLVGLGKRHNAGFFLPLPVVYQIAFFRKSSEDVDPLTKSLQLTDKLYDEMNYEQASSILKKLVEDVPDNDELMWRLARIKYELSKTASKDEKAKLLEEAQKLLENAINVNMQNGYAHKWLAILLDTVSSTKGIRERIELALEIRNHLLEAIKLIPKDGTTYYILGVWYFTIANFTWYEKKIASTLNSKFPSTTHAEALEYFKLAELAEPNFYSRNYLFLGKCYLKLQDNEKATEFLIRARDYPQKTTEDQDTFQEAVKLLQTLKVN